MAAAINQYYQWQQWQTWRNNGVAKSGSVEGVKMKAISRKWRKYQSAYQRRVESGGCGGMAWRNGVKIEKLKAKSAWRSHQ
jgi:hypothetical protein